MIGPQIFQAIPTSNIFHPHLKGKLEYNKSKKVLIKKKEKEVAVILIPNPERHELT